VAGGSVEVLTPNVVTDRSKVLDSVKAKWTQTLSVGGAKAKLVTIVQPSAKKDFLKELSLSGSVNDIAYTLKQKIGGGADLALQTTYQGTTLKAEGKVGLPASANKLTLVGASRKALVGGRPLSLKPSHAPQTGKTKLAVSADLGSGVVVNGEVSQAGGEVSTAYDFEYAASVSSGRTVSARFSPGDGSGELEYIDSESLDMTAIVTMPLGGKPKVALKRSFAF